MIQHFSEFLQRYPEWAPFACLVTGKISMRKLMFTRMVEGAAIVIARSAQAQDAIATLAIAVSILARRI